jgi:23S rRNA G2445 N2-methylase RlmL
MQIFTTPRRIIVTCNRGLAPAIERELNELGFQPLRVFNTGVELQGTLNDCIRLNLNLRCASQVMYSLKEFRCDHPEDLYKALAVMPWESWLDESGYFTVHGNVAHPTIRSSMFANVKVKDAIVDRIRDATGKRPDTGAELLGAVVYLFWRNDTAEIFFDTSGDTLAKHGYRKHPGKAPMVEALAAATILVGKWDKHQPFVNPMCGAGTIAIEAALLATGRAPGLFRTRFAFTHLKGYDSAVHRTQRDLLHHNVVEPEGLEIVATDISRDAIKLSRANAEQAGVDKYIQFGVCDFAETILPQNPGVVILNPEYGERLGDLSELEETYRRIGDFLKQKCGGYWGYVFTGNLDLAKKIGLKTKRRLEFATAQLDCRLLEFELYAGTRKREAS